MSSNYTRVVQALKRLPSIGSRSASRIAFHLLEANRDEVQELLGSIRSFVEGTKHCRICGLISEYNPCRICRSSKRQQDLICVVKNVQDAISIERSHAYRGLYHVLGGLIAPAYGVDEEHIRLQSLVGRCQRHVREIILALEQTPEAETTIRVLAKKVFEVQPNIRLTRMAVGIPIGTELEVLDATTLKRSLDNRTRLSQL